MISNWRGGREAGGSSKRGEVHSLTEVTHLSTVVALGSAASSAASLLSAAKGTVATSVTALWAVARQVTGLSTRVARATGSSSSSVAASAPGGALSADVTFLVAVVAGLGLARSAASGRDVAYKCRKAQSTVSDHKSCVSI